MGSSSEGVFGQFGAVSVVPRSWMRSLFVPERLGVRKRKGGCYHVLLAFLVGSSRTPAAFVKPCPSPCLVPCTHVVLSSTPSLHRAPVSPHPDSSSMYFYGRASFPFRDDTTPCVVEAFHSGAPAQTRQRVRQRARVHLRNMLPLAGCGWGSRRARGRDHQVAKLDIDHRYEAVGDAPWHSGPERSYCLTSDSHPCLGAMRCAEPSQESAP